jgi:hypothetical protein
VRGPDDGHSETVAKEARNGAFPRNRTTVDEIVRPAARRSSTVRAVRFKLV